MLAEKNKDIKKAYDLLQIISKDEKARMLYDAREAELRDQLTRMKSEKDKGRVLTAKAALKKGLAVELIAEITGLPLEEILKLDRNEVVLSHNRKLL